MNNACEICSRRSGSLFVTISKRYQKYTHVVKAHVCNVCHDVLIEQQELDGTTVETICQQDYNEMPDVQDIPWKGGTILKSPKPYDPNEPAK